MRHLSGTILRALALTLLGAAAASPLDGQVIRGVLLDDATLEPVEGARVSLLLLNEVTVRSTLTDADGVFHLPADLGEYLLGAQHVGYGAVVSQAFRMSTLDTLDVTFHVSAQAFILDPLVVGVPRVRGRELFEERRARGEGVFLGPELVDSLRPQRHVGEIFGHAEDVRVRWGSGRAENGRWGPMPFVSAYAGPTGCFHWIVDRTLVPDPFFEGATQWGVPPLSVLEPDDLVAVEVYRHWAEVPEEFEKQLLLANGQEQWKLRKVRRGECGIAILWTQRGW